MDEALYIHDMSISKSLRQHSLESLLIFFFGMLIVLAYCRECFVNITAHKHIFVFSGTLWVILWKGNEFMSDLADSQISWMERPVPRLVLGLCLHIFYSVLAVVLLDLHADWILFGEIMLDLKSNLTTTVPAIIITLFISLIFTARRFFLSWRDLAVQHEKLNTQAIASRFAALKNQVNPHFLFNSLNVLTNLVYKDADQAAKFIRKLSDVYRYVLDTKDKEVVPISDELKFVRDFVYLQKMRFGDDLKVMIKVQEHPDALVLPLSVQMLVENAIKHNRISADNPLNISIGLQQDHILVQNNLTPKKIVDDKKIGIGLENIRSRYQFLSNREVKVSTDPQHFTVQLPILTAN